MFNTYTQIADFDQELAAAMNNEAVRQKDHIELIASENYTSRLVLSAQGSILTNKYAEGYPGRRYYSGCEYVDYIEDLAINRAKQLFDAPFVNVQPHSGSQANAAVYLALLNPGDTILGMSLDHGGHLTHGCKVNFSGKIYNPVFYGVDPTTGLIDYNQVEELARQHKPRAIIAGFSAYSRIADWQKFREIADMVGAYLIADMAHVAGLVCTGLYPSPVNIADVTTTTTHKTLRGPRSGMILARDNPDLNKKLNSAVFPGLQGGPLMHAIAGKAVAFKEAMQPEFKNYQQQVLTNANYLANALMKNDLDIVANGTDCHLFTINLIKRDITGKDADAALSKANINVNKNTVPNDPMSPMVTSGVRIGTPAVTTRGFKEPEMQLICDWICKVLSDINNEQNIEQVKTETLELCSQFPVYQGE